MELTQHPYLAVNGEWRATGARVGDGVVERIDCRVAVTRADGGWDIRALGYAPPSAPSLPALRYDVRPPRQRGERVDWIATDATFGRLIGQFVAVDDSISSTFISADGRYSGSEWLRLDAGCYHARGVVLRDGELQRRWTLELAPVRKTAAADLRWAAAGATLDVAGRSQPAAPQIGG